jgi:ribosomal protein S18 acetylase RimI-like enzyme
MRRPPASEPALGIVSMHRSAHMNQTVPSPQITIRPLRPEDLEEVVAIDQAIEGRPRRTYIRRRLDAAVREPTRHVQFAASDGSRLVGYLLARLLRGEFGRQQTGLRIELVGVRSDDRHHGVGQRLLEALVEHARRKAVAELRTAARWNDHAMLRWFETMGFELSADRIVDCPIGDGAYRPERDDAVGLPAGFGPANEIDYGAPAGNDYEKLARDRADLRAMSAEDLPAIVRIDRLLTGRDRSDYMREQLAEALDDSAIRVSLVARLDDTVVGYLMARTDLGDFGRTEPVAIIDTIGVDPEYAHRGVGHALISQLFVNLGALRVERVETIIAPRDLQLLGFLYGCGFVPSQRLAFARPVQ